jgi:hypothetical protein
MKHLRHLVLAAPLALLAACGGSSPATATSEAAIRSAAPAYSTLSLDETGSDAVAPATPGAPTALTPDEMGMAAAPCQPHLFLRSHEVVTRINRHLYKFLVHVERALANQPAPATGLSRVWEHVRGGVDVKLTIAQDANNPNLFTWTLEMKKVADTAFVTVFSGSIDRTNAQGPHQGKGNMTLDLDKLASVTGEDVAGVVTAQFETFADHRQIAVHADKVVWDTDHHRGMGWHAGMGPAVQAPKSADYVYLREPGKGGSLKISEEMAFACPSNPELSQANVKLVSRWYRTTSGSVHGRSDAEMTSGQLTAAKIDKVVGLTCHQSAVEQDTPAEYAWLIKAEDSGGNTLWSRTSSAGTTPCDPALGATVPAPDNNKTDYDFSGIVFTDNIPFPFPGM